MNFDRISEKKIGNFFFHKFQHIAECFKFYSNMATFEKGWGGNLHVVNWDQTNYFKYDFEHGASSWILAMYGRKAKM